MDDLRERLRQSPEFVELEIHGETYGFLLTMYGVEVAKQKGHEVIGPALDLGNRIAGLLWDESAEDIEVGSPEMTKRLKSLVKDEDAQTLTLIVWWGLVTFHPDLEPEEVSMLLTPGTILNLIPKVVEAISSFGEDALPEDEVEEPSEEGGK